MTSLDSSPLPTPESLADALPASPAAIRSVERNREAIASVVRGSDPRLIVVTGPCSIHDTEAALEYAERLARISARFGDDLVIGMRVYLEKPRTTTGWKGFLHDPDLDGSSNVHRGLDQARRLMLRIAEHGLGIATELLDPVLSSYLAPLVSWAAIGARTTESQVHRALASAQRFAIGFKNPVCGRIDAAVNALLAAREPHTAFGIDAKGRASVSRTSGNSVCHIVLRGGQSGPNYTQAHIRAAARELERAATPEFAAHRIMIDCSHGNSQKDYKQQPSVWNDVCAQLTNGSPHLLGVMLESHLVAGQQPFASREKLRYGQSITDGCVDFQTTERLLEQLALAKRRSCAAQNHGIEMSGS